MILRIFDSPFKDCKFDIDPSTLSFSSSTDDYPYEHINSLNSISFVLSDPDTTQKVVKETKDAFKYNSNSDHYIRIRDKFESYESDKRPRITIFCHNGARGFRNPFTFELRNT